MYEQHPIGKELPRYVDTEEFNTLKDSIAEHGQLNDILIFEGKILDGWHRYQACIQLGIEPKIKMFEGDEDDALLHVMQTAVGAFERNKISKSAVVIKVARLMGGATSSTP